MKYDMTKGLFVQLSTNDIEKITSMVDFVFCAVNMKKDEIKALEAEEKSLLRKQRNHRIFTRGGMLEAFLQEPLLLTDDQVYSFLKVVFHRPEVDQILKQMIEENRRKISEEETR